LTAKLAEGACDDQSARQTDIAFLPDVLEARVGVTMDRVRATPYSITLSRDGTRIACGEFPRK
jgi:hypothetical protein